MSRIDLTVSVLETHAVRVLTFRPSMTATRAMATQANAKAVIDGVALLAAPHALCGVTGTFFCDTVAD